MFKNLNNQSGFSVHKKIKPKINRKLSGKILNMWKLKIYFHITRDQIGNHKKI